MVNNQVSQPGDEPGQPGTRGIPDSGSDVDEVRNELPGEPRATPQRPAQTPDQPETHGETGRSVREPGMGYSDEVRFSQNPAMQDDNPARPAQAGFVGTGMFFTVVIIGAVALVMILWYLL